MKALILSDSRYKDGAFAIVPLDNIDAFCDALYDEFGNVDYQPLVTYIDPDRRWQLPFELELYHLDKHEHYYVYVQMATLYDEPDYTNISADCDLTNVVPLPTHLKG